MKSPMGKPDYPIAFQGDKLTIVQIRYPCSQEASEKVPQLSELRWASTNA